MSSSLSRACLEVISGIISPTPNISNVSDANDNPEDEGHNRHQEVTEYPVTQVMTTHNQDSNHLDEERDDLQN